jgi:hypothetical protein
MSAGDGGGDDVPGTGGVRAALAVTEELHAKQQEAARKEAERAARKAPQDAAADAKGEAGEPASKKPREKEPRASTTDAQARVMKMADGGFRPAYNVQFATDTKSTAIAGVSVDNIGSDMGKMLPMNDALAGQYHVVAQQTTGGDAAIVWNANAGVAATKACIAPLDDPGQAPNNRVPARG